MNDLFAVLVLGHLIGDYLLQNKWMALKKSSNSFICAIHCAIYTVAVTATTWPVIHGVAWTVLIFVSHYVIDRWGLVDWWLHLIQGRSLRGFLSTEEFKNENYRALQAGFTALVYAVADNTVHLVLMFYGAQCLEFFKT